MQQIHHKTIEDLEFNTLLVYLSQLAITDLGKDKILQIKPFTDRDKIITYLSQTNEYLSSIENQNYIPAHNFDEITNEIRFLAIENSVLEINSFRKIKNISEIVNSHILFFQKFNDYYPNLSLLIQNIPLEEQICIAINKIIDKFVEIKK